MTTLSRLAALRQELQQAVDNVCNARSYAERETALSCLGIHTVEAQCEGVSVPEIRQLVGSYWPSISPGIRER